MKKAWKIPPPTPEEETAKVNALYNELSTALKKGDKPKKKAKKPRFKVRERCAHGYYYAITASGVCLECSNIELAAAENKMSAALNILTTNARCECRGLPKCWRCAVVNLLKP